MDSAPGAERLTAARWEAHQACTLLIACSPEDLRDSQDALQRAIASLNAFRSDHPNCFASAGVRSMLADLKTEALRADALLQSLARFYRGWEQVLGSMSGGYTPDGAPAAVVRPGRVYCRG